MKTNIIKFIGIALLFIVSLSFGFSWLYKDKIKTEILSQANKQVNAQITLEDIELSFIRNFPKLQIQAKNLKIIGVQEFQKDTLASIPKLTISISLWKYLKESTILINSLAIEEAKINVKVLASGKANWDIMKASKKSENTEKSSFQLSIDNYLIDNSSIEYNDLSRNFYTKFTGFNHEGNGNFKEEIFTLQTKTEVKQWDLEFLGKPLLNNVQASLDAPILMDFKKMQFKFSNNVLQVNELPINFSYELSMPDSTMDMNLTFATNNSPLKHFLSLIPSLYTNNFEKLTSSGKATLKGSVIGKLSNTQIPNFNLNLLIQKGAFSYEGKAERIQQLELNFFAKNAHGKIDETEIQLKPFNFHLNNESFASNLLVKNPTRNPFLQGNIQTKLHLENVAKLFPKEGLNYAGLLEAKVQFEGNLNELKSGKGNVMGNAQINNFNGTFQNKLIQIPNITGTFNSNSLQAQTSFNYLNAPFTIVGKIGNIFGYVLKGEDLETKLKVNIQSLAITKAFDNFKIVQTYLPITKNLIGNISPSFDFSGNFNKSFDLVLPSVQAEGSLTSTEIDGTTSPIFKKLLQVAKWKGANDLHIKPINLNFKITDGRLLIKPFNLNSSVGTFTISGSNGLDQTLNYVVSAKFDAGLIDSKTGASLNSKLEKLNSSVGNIIQKIPLEFSISGNIKQPSIQVSLSGNKNFKEASKELIKAEIKTQKNKGLDEAKLKADQEIQKAKLIAEDLKTKAYQEADQLIEQANNPLTKFAAKKLADKLKKEADKRVEKILQDAQIKADEIIQKAKSE